MYTYDKEKIGKRIATGGDRKVFMYDKDKVIKFSTLSFLAGKKLHIKYNNDYLVCRNYLKEYIVETTDVSDLVTGQHIEIQPFITGEMLKKKHTKNPYIKSQINEIIQAIEKMKNDGSPIIDLVGNVGMISPCLSNIIVDSSDRLKIIDAILLEGKTVRPLGLILELFMPIILARQNYFLRSFIK